MIWPCKNVLMQQFKLCLGSRPGLVLIRTHFQSQNDTSSGLEVQAEKYTGGTQVSWTPVFWAVMIRWCFHVFIVGTVVHMLVLIVMKFYLLVMTIILTTVTTVIMLAIMERHLKSQTTFDV